MPCTVDKTSSSLFCSSPFSSSSCLTSAARCSCCLFASAVASLRRRSTSTRRSSLAARSANMAWRSRCNSSVSLASIALKTMDGSYCTSKLISALFFTSFARRPNSSEPFVSSLSSSNVEHVMMRQVFELPPKDSAKSRVSIASRYGMYCDVPDGVLVKRWMTSASCDKERLISPASRRWSRGDLGDNALRRAPETLPRVE
mmetsp:Transcript_69457/g.193259  ORF Transcript_69457/g.193259 Transcript_69457/m.193259 type:complete len:201 (-) Transcript_69457:1546-2148(-)